MCINLIVDFYTFYTLHAKLSYNIFKNKNNINKSTRYKMWIKFVDKKKKKQKEINYILNKKIL